MPDRHKETNKFRFRTFNERVQHVRVSAAYRLRTDRAVRRATEGAESAFAASIARWSELDLSRPFQLFYYDIKYKINNYALIIHNQQHIFEKLIKHLDLGHIKNVGWLAVPALMEFLVAFATDLVTDFEPYFYQTFEVLKKLLVTTDLELVESIFTCASRLVKLNNKFLLSDLSKAITIFTDLVQNQKREYIQTFSGEVFAYLLRKLSRNKQEISSFWCHLVDKVRENEKMLNGTGLLLFQSVRGIKNQLDYRAEFIIVPLLSLNHVAAIQIVKIATAPLFDHLNRENSDKLVDWFIALHNTEKSVLYLSLLVKYRTGILVKNVSRIIDFVIKHQKDTHVIPLVGDLLKSSIPITRNSRQDLMDVFVGFCKFSDADQLCQILQTNKELVTKEWFSDDYLLYAMNIASCIIERDFAETDVYILQFLLEYIVSRHNEISDVKHVLAPMFDFRLATTKPTTSMTSKLCKIALNNSTDSWAALTILSYCQYVDSDEISTVLESKSLKDQSSVSLINYSAAIQLHLTHLTKIDNSLIDDIMLKYMEVIEQHSADLSLLRSLDKYLEFPRPDFTLDTIYDKLKNNLSHHNRHVRRTTLSIFSHLSAEFPEDNFVFQTLLTVESIMTELSSYRSKLNHLRKLDSKKSWNTRKQDVFFRYLFGCLYLNFNLVLPEIKKMLVKELHRCFEVNRESTLEALIETMHSSIKLCHSTGFEDYASISDHYNITSIYSPYAVGLNEKPDVFTYRQKVWSLSADMSHYLEPKSRMIIPLFFEFIADEYSREIQVQNVLETDLSTHDVNNQLRKSKNTRKMLVNTLNLIAKFQNPAVLYREPDLMALYLQLLQSPDSTLQKAALNCLISYRKSVAAMYGSVLLELVDEMTFKSSFKKLVVTEDSSEEAFVKEEHEGALFNIALRIGFGKMISKVAPGTAGSSAAAERQKFVLRNLVDAKIEQLHLFYNLALKPLSDYDLVSELDMTRLMPLGKQLGVLQTIQVLVKSINWSSEKVPQLQNSLLNSILSFGYNATTALKTKLITRNKYLSQLREIRTESIKSLHIFCECIKWPFGEPELNRIFKWLGDMIINLQSDSLDKISPLLKLIRLWAASNEYNYLILKQFQSTYLLEHVCAMLKPGIIFKDVAIVIMEIVSTLFDKDLTFDETKCDCLLRIKPTLLNYFESILAKGKHSSLNKEMLELVVNLSMEVNNEQMSNRIAFLLVSQLQSGAGFLLNEILTSMAILLKQTTDNDKIASELVLISGTLQGHEQRALLVSCFHSMSYRDGKYDRIYKTLKGLNLVKKHFGDPVDYDGRLVQLNKIVDELNNQTEILEADLLYWKAVTLNSLFMYESFNDISIQSLCSRTLLKIMQCVRYGSGIYDTLVTRLILPTVRRMLKFKDEKTRFEFSQMLAEIVKIYGSDSELGQLACLADPNVDLDYFTNVSHLQYHKRQRAYNRAVAAIKEEKINAKVAEKYVFPLAICTLMDTTLLTQTQLLNSALELVTAVAQKMSWSNFRRFFDLQLSLAMRGISKATESSKDNKSTKHVDYEERQKMTIKIVCRLIGCIHWPIENVSDEFKAQIGRIANLNYSDQSGLREFEIVESKPKSFKVGIQKDTLVLNTETVEVDCLDDKSENRPDEEQMEIVEGNEQDLGLAMDVETNHSGELLEKIYRYFHLSIRPKFYKLISPPKYVEPGANPADFNERTVRIPVATALVSLLIKLGPDVVRAYIPGVVLKLVDLLRSREYGQREAARKALLGMLDELGDEWFHVFLEELRSGLQRGYQKVVLIASIHQLLVHHKFKNGAIDNCVESINEVLITDLVGDLHKERKVAKLVEKTPEAKSRNHVIGCYRHVAEIISESAVSQLIEPLKGQLLSSVDGKLHQQVDKALSAISDGLIANKAMLPKYCILLSAKIFEEGLEFISERKKNNAKDNKKPGQKPDSCLLLHKEKINKSKDTERETVTNRHYLVQFGLQLILSCIKLDKISINGEDTETLSHLDGLVRNLIDMLVESRHMTEQTKILRIFTRMFKNSNFPSLQDVENQSKLQKQLFYILKQSCRGTRQNIDFVSATFKAVTVLISSTYCKLEHIHFQVLLNYAEEDLYNADRQSLAFPLLHALIKKEIRTPDMDSIGEKLLKLMVTGETEMCRNSSKNVFCVYLLEYPLGEVKIQRLFDKLLGNLAYGEESGRQSIFECLQQIVKQFPERMLAHKSSLIFSALCAAFSGDAAFSLREKAGNIILILLRRIPDGDYYKLMLKFIQNKDSEQKRLSLLLINLLSEEFYTKIPVFDMLDEIVLLFREEYNEDNMDSLLIALLQAFQNIIVRTDLTKKHREKYSEILSRVEQFLVHPHAWARQSATNIMLSILEKVDLYELASNEPSELKFYWDDKKARSLALRHIVQLKSPHVERDHMEENRNLISLLLRVFSIAEENRSSNVEKKSDLLWLIQKLNSVAAFENSDRPTEVVRRELVVEILIGFMNHHKQATKYTNVMLEVFYREAAASDDSKQTPEELKRGVYQASMVAKKLIGEDLFTKNWESARTQIIKRRSERKRNLNQKAVIDPEAFNRMKIRKQDKERKRKKRVLGEMKPGNKLKKLKFNTVEKL